jgi:hypothetical protein
VAIIIFASICAPIASIVAVKAAGFTKLGVTKGMPKESGRLMQLKLIYIFKALELHI